jgi:hypothetical protein
VACHEFDGQVVRLEQIKEGADQFVRVRLPRIDNLDLALFEFDYDLTFMVFFLNADGKVYARYGGRDGEDPDHRQSLAGLRYTMESVLAMHGRADKEFAPRTHEAPKYIQDVPGGRRTRGCFHCHQVKEVLNSDLVSRGEWNREKAWRYPLPENVGIQLEVDRSNVVKEMRAKSPAAEAGLIAGDVVRRLNGVPVHSFADVQFALDIAPSKGTIEVAWQRGDKELTAKVSLPEGWRRSDLLWRPSMHRMVPSARMYGLDLTAEEKKALGLAPQRLAFRQKNVPPPQVKAAGVLIGDIIIGVDGKELEMPMTDFLRYVSRSYLVGDTVTINAIRDGKPVNLSMTLQR